MKSSDISMDIYILLLIYYIIIMRIDHFFKEKCVKDSFDFTYFYSDIMKTTVDS